MTSNPTDLIERMERKLVLAADINEQMVFIATTALRTLLDTLTRQASEMAGISEEYDHAAQTVARQASEIEAKDAAMREAIVCLGDEAYFAVRHILNTALTTGATDSGADRGHPQAVNLQETVEEIVQR